MTAETQIVAIISILYQAVRYSVPLLFGTTGEIIIEKSGSLNLGVEGMMAVGSIFGFLGATLTGSLFMGILIAFVASGFLGLLFAFLTVTLQANQNVTGLTITIFGVGLYRFIGQTLKAQDKFPAMSDALIAKVADKGIPFLRDIPYVGKLLFSYNIFVYIGIILAVILWIYLRFTRQGLKVRAIGENPGAADGVGINITRTKYLNTVLGAGVSGIGGLYMAMIINRGAWNENWINGFGWIAIALVIFANWSPAKAIFGSFLFGIFVALQSMVSLIADAFPGALGWLKLLPSEFYMMLPFLITALVLIFSSMKKSKAGRTGPAAIGLSYYREDR